MPNNHFIKVINLQILKDYDNKQNVVDKVTFSVNAENETNQIGSVISSLDLNVDNLTNFIAFENLTEVEIKNWISNIVGDAQIEVWYEKADQQLQNLIAPNQIVVNPPWM